MIPFNIILISLLLLRITCMGTDELNTNNETLGSTRFVNIPRSNESFEDSGQADGLLPGLNETDASSSTRPSNVFNNPVQNNAAASDFRGDANKTESSTPITTPDYLSSERHNDTVSEFVENAGPNDESMPLATPDFLSGKHASLLTCSMIVLEPGEYELLPNGSLNVEPYNITYDESLFFVLDDMVHFCDPKFVVKEFQPHLFMTADMTKIGLAISMACLFLHLLVFVLVPDLRNLPGWNLAALCLSLLISYSLIVIGEAAQGNPDFCFAVALLTHFFFMSSFLWMSIMSFDVYVSLLRVTGSLRVSSTHFKLKKFAMYSICSFGVAFVFALLGFLADILESIPVDLKPNFKETCWFTEKKPLMIFFGAPVIALICLNLLFFLLSSYKIYANKMKYDEDDHKSVLRQNNLMYFRLSVIMGVTWVVGVLAVVVHTNWLWALFVAFNTLQGLFIFLAFSCNKKVKKFFRQKFMGKRPSEQVTLSPTFQSYCFYANSIEKDLDKFVETKTDSKSVIDTVVIHL